MAILDFVLVIKALPWNLICSRDIDTNHTHEP